MVRCYKAINFIDKPVDFFDKRIIIWGISVSGLEAYIYLTARGAKVVGFTDSYARDGGEFAGKPVLSFEKIQEMDSPWIFVSTVNGDYLKDILNKTDSISNATVLCKRTIYGAGKYDVNRLRAVIESDQDIIDFVRKHLTDIRSKEVFDKLIEYRTTNNEQLLKECYEKEHLQYFPTDTFISLGNNEIFVDAGAYNGDTSCIFAEKCGGSYKKIYLMEPDKRLYQVTKEYIKLKGLHDAKVINKGAYSHSTVIRFDNDFESGSSNIRETGEEEIETIAIDEMLNGEPVTFIKMDIEGAERQALEGSINSIDKYHPKLAISIYHMEDDLWRIPYMIMNKFPFYKFYIRHYTDITTETILYAVE